MKQHLPKNRQPCNMCGNRSLFLCVSVYQRVCLSACPFIILTAVRLPLVKDMRPRSREPQKPQGPYVPHEPVMMRRLWVVWRHRLTHTDKRTNGQWTDGQASRRTSRQTGTRTNEQTDGRTQAQTDRRTDDQTEARTDRQTERQTDRPTDRRTDGQMDR